MGKICSIAERFPIFQGGISKLALIGFELGLFFGAAKVS
jgi:hypothetical protein